MNVNPTDVSVIGLGLMGSALAEAFLRNQKSLTVWNRTRQKSEPLGEMGAQIAATAADALNISPVVIVCVSDYATANAVLRTPEATQALKGKVLIQLSTGIPREADESASWAKENGISYLDGAIMSYPSGIGDPECTILYAGPQSTYEMHKDLLTSLGGNPVFTGESIGSACVLDASLLSFNYQFNIAFLHGAAIAESGGIPLDEYLESVNMVMPVLVHGMGESIDRIKSQKYTATDATMNTHAAALEHIVQLSEESGVALPPVAGALEHAKEAITAGYGDGELAALFEVLRTKK